MKFKKQGKNQDPEIYTAWKNQQTNKEKKPQKTAEQQQRIKKIELEKF